MDPLKGPGESLEKASDNTVDETSSSNNTDERSRASPPRDWVITLCETSSSGTSLESLPEAVEGKGDREFIPCNSLTTGNENSSSSSTSLDSFTEEDLRACSSGRACHCPRSHPDNYTEYVEEKRSWRRLRKQNRWEKLYVTCDFMRVLRTVKKLPRGIEYRPPAGSNIYDPFEDLAAEHSSANCLVRLFES